MGACSISSLRTFHIFRDRRFVTIPANIKKNLITNCVINRLMSVLFHFNLKKMQTLTLSVPNFRRHCRLLFYFNKLSLEKKFIRKAERLNVKQRRSR